MTAAKTLRVEVDRTPDAVAQEVAQAATPSQPYFILTGLASILAAYGLLADSPAVIIGAMLVAMLLNPITGLSFALVTADGRLLGQAIIAETLGVALAFGVGMAVAWINPGLSVTGEMLSRSDPGLLDLVIAVAGGSAVAYATGNTKLNAALAGVAIATALLPPLVNSGMLLVYGQYTASLGAFVLFASNFASIIFAASAVFWLLGYGTLVRSKGKSALVSLARVGQIALFVALAVHLAFRFEQQLEIRTRQATLEAELSEQLKPIRGSRLIETRIAPSSDPDFVIATVRTPNVITPAQVEAMEKRLSPKVLEGLRLRVRSIPIVSADARGYVFKESSDPPNNLP